MNIEFSSDLANLPKCELEYFLTEYNAYIQEFYDNHDENCFPVCMAEFYNNEFQELCKEM